MDFLEIIEQARDVLQRKGRMTYRTLKRQFALDDEALEDLKAEFIKAERVAQDEDGEVLVWIGEGINGEKDKRINGNTEGEKGKRGNGTTEGETAKWRNGKRA
jgi:hypothetical protein